MVLYQKTTVNTGQTRVRLRQAELAILRHELEQGEAILAEVASPHTTSLQAEWWKTQAKISHQRQDIAEAVDSLLKATELYKLCQHYEAASECLRQASEICISSGNITQGAGLLLRALRIYDLSKV